MIKRSRQASMLVAAVAVVSGLLSSHASAQIVVDGTLDAAYGTPLTVQTVNTGFGDNQSELDALYAKVDPATRKLNIFLAGNAESNNNKLVLFFDTKAGGQNVMRSDNANVNFNNLNTKYAGFTFDTGFEADYWFSISRDNSPGTAYVDYAELLTNGGGAGGFAGSIPVPTANTPQQGAGTVGGQNGSPVFKYGYNDANLAGVSGAAPTAADPVAPTLVTTGAEYEFDLDTLGVNGDFKVMAFINGSNHDYASNQFLPGLPAPQGNLAGDGAGNYTGTVAGINLNNFAGDQFITIAGPVAPTYTWNVNADGNWSTAGNWTGSTVPNGASIKATLGSAINAARTVTLDVPVTLKAISFDNAAGYTVNGSNTLTINGNSSIAALEVVSGSHTISAPVALVGPTRADIAAGSTLSLTGTVTAAGQDVTKLGDGTLVMPATDSNSVSVNAGTLKLTGAGNSIVKGATIATGTTLDLTSSALVVNYDIGFSPLAQLKANLAASELKATGYTAIGYIDTAVTGTTSPVGTFDADTLVFRGTLLGDSTLDRLVNFSDLLVLAANYNQSGVEWYQGDSTGDGLVNFSDLLVLAANYNQSVTGSFAGDWALAQSLVPEPTMLAALGAAGLGVLARRRKV
ncbi:MAG: PEP-CTERM sorting domain-containing protein [Tepidisphaeraceae bacterium]